MRTIITVGYGSAAIWCAYAMVASFISEYNAAVNAAFNAMK